MLRSNEVSTKIHPDLATINTSYMQNAYAIHTAQHYNYILAIPVGGSTTNNSVYVFDTRYNAWMKWDDMNIQCMTVLVDSTNTENVLYGDALEGRVDKFYSGSNDKGSAFTFRMRTKDFNAKAFHLIKTFIWPTFHFRNILGNMTVTTITDGATNQSTVTISSTLSYLGWGYDKWASVLWGDTNGSAVNASSTDAPRQKNIRIDARSIMFLLENTSTSDTFTILGVECNYLLRKNRRLPNQYIIQ